MAAKVVPGLTTNQRMNILDELRPEKQQPGDVTIKIATKEWGISSSKVRDILEKAVDEGKMEKIKAVLDHGKFGILYRPVENRL